MRGSAAIRVNVGALPVGSFILKRRDKDFVGSRSLPNVVNNGTAGHKSDSAGSGNVA